jgi:hypothetical protein
MGGPAVLRGVLPAYAPGGLLGTLSEGGIVMLSF